MDLTYLSLIGNRQFLTSLVAVSIKQSELSVTFLVDFAVKQIVKVLLGG